MGGGYPSSVYIRRVYALWGFDFFVVLCDNSGISCWGLHWWPTALCWLLTSVNSTMTLIHIWHNDSSKSPCNPIMIYLFFCEFIYSPMFYFLIWYGFYLKTNTQVIISPSLFITIKEGISHYLKPSYHHYVCILLRPLESWTDSPVIISNKPWPCFPNPCMSTRGWRTWIRVEVSITDRTAMTKALSVRN